MNKELSEHEQHLEDFAIAPFLLENMLKIVPEAAWTFRRGAEEWTISQIVLHLAESEAVGFVRCRQAIAQPGSTILGFDQIAWSKRLDNSHQKLSDAIVLFATLRKMTLALLSPIPEPEWDKYFYNHTETGKVTLKEWLITHVNHFFAHFEQIDLTHEAWRAENAKAKSAVQDKPKDPPSIDSTELPSSV